MADSMPPTEPSGSLQPPGRLPPTAVGVAMLPPEEPVRPTPERSRVMAALRRAVERVFDASDDLALRIRRAIRSA